MSEQRAGSSRNLAIWLIIAGGVLALVGSFLPWAKVAFGPASQSAKGFDGWEGKVTAIAGASLMIRGFLMTRGKDRGLLPMIMLQGLVASGVSLYDILTVRTQAINAGAADISKSTGVPVDQVKTTLHGFLDAGRLTISLEFGILVVLVGGILGIVGGLMLSAARKRQVATSPGSTPRAPDAGFSEGWVMTPPPAPVGAAEPPSAPDPVAPDPVAPA